MEICVTLSTPEETMIEINYEFIETAKSEFQARETIYEMPIEQYLNQTIE